MLRPVPRRNIYSDLAGENVRWHEYSAEREEAIRACEEVETATRRFPGAETVLVQVGSVEALRCAYPELLRRHDRLRRRAQKAIRKNARAARPSRRTPA
ncbi:MAG: hypothetical protein OXG35_24490 [Acidobacteria bacterium]|nr:hypothetical protein [Acidobacteriota bacterium]